MLQKTPSSVLYADLRIFGGITNKNAARILLSPRVAAGGKSPRDRIESRTYLSRQVVHVSPGDVNPTIYADFYTSVQTLSSRIATHIGGSDATDRMTYHYAGEAADEMCRALRAHALDDQVYLNECSRLSRVRLRVERDRPLLLLMLFCITGCLADAGRATTLVEDFARTKLAMDLATVMAESNTASVKKQDDGPVALGLLRLIGNMAQPPILPLSPEGTTVGALATGPGSITNVGPDVSRTHARIWYDKDRWLIQGLQSTNGTTLTLASTQEIICVEPPIRRRDKRFAYPPEELHENDVICFGTSTRYLVLRVRSND